jgi:hypothetical protein
LICVGLTGERKGKIYWWERTKERDQPTYDNVFHLADSLKEFLDALHPFEG